MAEKNNNTIDAAQEGVGLLELIAKQMQGLTKELGLSGQEQQKGM